MLGVGDEVDHDLLQVLTEAEDRWDAEIELGQDLDVVGPQDALADLGHVADQVVHLDARGIGVGAAGEAQQAAHDARGAIYLAHDGRGRGFGLRVARAALQQLGLHANRRERVVDLVGDAARDLADRGELLARDQLALGAELVGAVIERDEDVVGAEAGEHRDRAITDAAVARGRDHDHASMPRRLKRRPREHVAERDFTR